MAVYLFSICVWFCLIYFTARQFGDRIEENGWLKHGDNIGSLGMGLLICISAVPVLRILIEAVIIYMACAYNDNNL